MPDVYDNAFDQYPNAYPETGRSSEGQLLDSIDYAGHLQLEHFGRPITHIAQDGSQHTFDAIVHREKRVQSKNDNGWDEIINRDVAFPSNDETGRSIVIIHSEIMIQNVRYTIELLDQRQDFWHCTLRRLLVGEIHRPNRRK